jgi:hypothetical protein
VSEVVAAIETAEPGIKGRITYDDSSLTFPDGQEDTALRELLGDFPNTPLQEGVARTVAHFKQALADGRLPQEVST